MLVDSFVNNLGLQMHHRFLWSAIQRFPVAWIIHLLFLSYTDIQTVGIAQVYLDLNKLYAVAAVEHSSGSLKNCEDSDIECACCLKRDMRQNYVGVQAVKVSVIVAKTARYQTGPHINGCAKLSNLSSH